ncbi:MAG: conjugal transfer protein TraG N-terminal domain-containing protein [Rickettsiales bacterium]|jgi:conjugal transfer mating pair stabilization protein TraG|nr:conjugal transfer protein TraG N-terminal domain-containing protein [Rickettsiales bacterium]
MFLPKVRVLITDRINPNMQMGRSIDDVPWGLAFFANIITSIGDSMTRAFDMNFSLPDDLQYSKTGMLFGSQIIQRIATAKIKNSNAKASFNNYIRQCIFNRVNMKVEFQGQVLDYELLKKAKNINEFIEYGSTGILAYTYIKSNGEEVFLLCDDNKALREDLKNGIDEETKEIGTHEEATQYVTNIAGSQRDLLEQSLIASSTGDSTKDYLALTGSNAGAINYALTKDDIQRKESGIISWLQAGKYLPLLKVVLECIFYALFPFVILFAMLPKGFKIISGYFMILISLQLWSPLYAVLNLIMTLEQHFRASGLEGVINISTKGKLFNASMGIQMQASLISLSIPFIAQKIINGGISGLTELSGQITSGMQQSASALASETSTGNFTYGNLSMNNRNYDNTSSNNTSSNKYDTVESIKGYHNVNSQQSLSKSIQNSKAELERETKQFAESVGVNYEAGAGASFIVKASLTKNEQERLEQLKNKEISIQKMEQDSLNGSLTINSDYSAEYAKAHGLTKEQFTNLRTEDIDMNWYNERFEKDYKKLEKEYEDKIRREGKYIMKNENYEEPSYTSPIEKGYDKAKSYIGKNIDEAEKKAKERGYFEEDYDD